MLRTFTELAPVEIVRAWGARELYGSLILANVQGWRSTAESATREDQTTDLFEVVCCRHGARWRIALMALRAATVGLGNQPRVSQFDFVTPQSVPSKSTGKSFTWKPGHKSLSCAYPMPSLPLARRRGDTSTEACVRSLP